MRLEAIQLIVIAIFFVLAALGMGGLAYYCAYLYNKEHKDDNVIGKRELEYLSDLEISISHARLHPNNCAVIERDGDGKSVGICWFYLKDGVCPRHGKVKV